MLNYQRIIAESKNFATSHVQINSFGNGDLWECVQRNQLAAFNYPMLWLQDAGVRGQGNSEFVSFNIFAFDQVLNGESNENFVKNSMKQLLDDYCAYFKQTSLYDIDGNRLLFNFQVDTNFTSFTERFNDTLTGYTCQISFKVPKTFNKCDIPLIPLPTPDPFICSVEAIVKNTDGDTLATKTVSSDDNVITVPNISFTDSDGTVTSEPSGVNLVCTPEIKDLTIAIPYAAADDTSTVNIIENAVGTITSAVTTGLTTVAYTVNATPVTIPFALVLSDVLEITYDAASSDGVIILSGTYV